MSRDLALPNPGSLEAIAPGCICPVLDNCHGRFAPRPPNGWLVIVGCPLHDPANDHDPREERAEVPIHGGTRESTHAE